MAGDEPADHGITRQDDLEVAECSKQLRREIAEIATRIAREQDKDVVSVWEAALSAYRKRYDPPAKSAHEVGDRQQRATPAQVRAIRILLRHTKQSEQDTLTRFDVDCLEELPRDRADAIIQCLGQLRTWGASLS